MLLRPPALMPGDWVCILSTARKIEESELLPAIAWMRAQGWEVILGATIGAAHHQYAGSDELRRSDLQKALDDPSIKAVFCARGGYGTVRILDQLNFNTFMRQPKWIIGFSDITYLHTHISNILGIQTLHAAMPVTFPQNTSETWAYLAAALAGDEHTYSVPPSPLNRLGDASGIMIGGNLSILYSITGTKSGMNMLGKLLFLEDLDEYLYHIDRMMMNLKRSGKLEGLAGLIVGGMSDMKDNAVPFGKQAEEIILEHAAEYNFPISFGFPAGHIAANWPLRMGGHYALTVNTDSSVLKPL